MYTIDKCVAVALGENTLKALIKWYLMPRDNGRYWIQFILNLFVIPKETL